MVKTFSPGSHHSDLCPSMFQRQTSPIVPWVIRIKFQSISTTDRGSRRPWVQNHIVNTFAPGSQHWDLCPSNFQRQTSLSVSWVLLKKLQPIPITGRASRPKQTQQSVIYHMVKTFSPGSHHSDLCPSMFHRQTSPIVPWVVRIKFQAISTTDRASRPK